MRKGLIVILLLIIIFSVYSNDLTDDLLKINKRINKIELDINELNINIKDVSDDISDIKNELSKKELIDHLQWLIPSLALIISLIVLIRSFFHSRKEEYILFSKIVEEYSTKEIHDAIKNINKFVEIIGCKIDVKTKQEEKRRKIKQIVREYIKFNNNENDWKSKHENKIKNKINFTWFDLDNCRRILANYFIKILMFYNKGWAIKKMIEDFWSKHSLIFLSEYIIPLDYIAKPIIMNNIIPDDYYKRGNLMLVKYINKYKWRERKIENEELKNIYNEIINEGNRIKL